MCYLYVHEAFESKPVKLETSQSVILPSAVSILWLFNWLSLIEG